MNVSPTWEETAALMQLAVTQSAATAVSVTLDTLGTDYPVRLANSQTSITDLSIFLKTLLVINCVNLYVRLTG